ncbi:protein translocase subunit SecF [Natranaeroarchaeum sulfidigenes]|uniref:Protein-export membrane protein SecF n=1 Tax=Natranaeroarchaeum sulfidigenes TaxID=2784880 RepID=A0A897MM23_9EURY|nr:protein translocase subunit SecF [Natranaeroarchaeum sulfidigenes]QSG01657.1 Preprotein translocase subunit SecF [Natranaeroarchaeum sulfidigenes]
MRQFDVPEPDYDRYTNRQLAAVPLAVLAVALAVIIGWFIFTGAPATLGIDFAGGTELTVETSDDPDTIETAFAEDVENIRSTQHDNQWILEFRSDDAEAIEQQADENLSPVEGSDSVVQEASTFSASFGSDNQRTALYGLTAAFLGMAVLAFALFRTFIPSIAIVVSAFSDIMIPLAAMNLLGIPLSLATVAGLLMLIGYSVDSDILLNNHILRRSGDFYESTYRAMQTGVTMTVTSMSAMAVLTVVAYLFGIGILWQIGFVLVIGLMADLMNTYLLNLSLLRWYKFEGVKR